LNTKINPTVSVIIPTYNRERLLVRSVKSVLNQTYQDFEIIIVDDASTDNTEKVVRSFNDERIRYVRHDKNKGEAAARNTGIKLARGKYIASQDSDDEWLPEKLHKQIDLIEKSPPHVGVVYTGFWKIEQNKKTYIPFAWVKQKQADIHQELMKGNFIGCPVTLIKKQCFQKAGGFDESLSNLVDWEMWLRISKHYHFSCIDEPLAIAYYDKDNISDNPYSLATALESILSKHIKDFKKNKKLLRKYYITIGHILMSANHIIKGWHYLIKALSVCPFDIRLLSATFLAFLGEDIYNKVVVAHQKTTSINL